MREVSEHRRPSSFALKALIGGEAGTLGPHPACSGLHWVAGWPHSHRGCLPPSAWGGGDPGMGLGGGGPGGARLLEGWRSWVSWEMFRELRAAIEL